MKITRPSAIWGLGRAVQIPGQWTNRCRHALVNALKGAELLQLIGALRR